MMTAIIIVFVSLLKVDFPACGDTYSCGLTSTQIIYLTGEI